MQKDIKNNQEKQSDTSPEIRRFMKILSMDHESGNLKETIHEYKDNNGGKKSKIIFRNLDRRSTYCVNCGREATIGIFCSIKCEGEMYGVNP